MAQQKRIFVIFSILLMIVLSEAVLAAETLKPVRIGVYVRSGFEACMEDWTPVAEGMTQKVSGYRFVVVPLASREDVFAALEKRKIDFLVTNPAIYVCAEERFGASALCGMVNRLDPSEDYHYTGSLVRKSSRNDLARIEDLREAQLSAVKPWSFSGWLMQWQALRQHGVDPLRKMPPVSYEGTHEEVLQSVLDETADVGAVATDILAQQIEAGKIDSDSLFVFDSEGNAVALGKGKEIIASTAAYPDWVFAKAADTPGALAEKVLKSLLAVDQNLQPENINGSFAWTTPQNYQPVREMLTQLVGPDYAYVETFGERRIALPGLSETIAMVLAIALAIFLFVAWRHARRRGDNVGEEMENLRAELHEVRAGKHLIETILTQVQCGIDIVNEDNEIVYVTPGIEHHYGPWRGKRCHEYYLGSSEPCEHCLRRAASQHRKEDPPYIESCRIALQDGIHLLDESDERSKSGKLLQVPFYDENGRWLYARIHLPSEESLEKLNPENVVVSQG